MTFLNSFEAVHYRGIDGLSFPHLAPANLITGVNGVGKTAVLEAMWLFTGRHNTSLLWNANVQRSNNAVLDPVARLAKNALELRGSENGTCHSLKVVFRKVVDIDGSGEMPIQATPENPFATPPVVAHIYTELDGNPPKREFRTTHATPWGSVAFENKYPLVARPIFTILGKRFQSEIPKEYLQRYSDIVRSNRKNDFIAAINLILPKVKEVEILTDELGESYLSAVTTDDVRLPLHALGGGVVRLSQFFPGLLHISRWRSLRG